MRWLFRIGKREIEIPPASDILVDVSEALISMLVAGGGIGIAATFVAQLCVARGELVPVLTDFAVEWHNVTALWPESRRTAALRRTKGCRRRQPQNARRL